MPSLFFVLLVCVVNLAEVIVLTSYYFPLLKQVPASAWLFNVSGTQALDPHNVYVSDLLFNDSVYRALMTGLIALHLCACALSVVRGGGCELELCCLGVAWIGWVVLVAVYEDASGHVKTGHLVGTGLFIAGCALYFGLVAWRLVSSGDFPWSNAECFSYSLAVVVFMLSIGLGVTFVVGFFEVDRRLAWIYEHAAFILFAGSNLLLFVAEGLFETAEPLPSRAMLMPRIRRQ